MTNIQPGSVADQLARLVVPRTYGEHQALDRVLANLDHDALAALVSALVRAGRARSRAARMGTAETVLEHWSSEVPKGAREWLMHVASGGDPEPAGDGGTCELGCHCHDPGCGVCGEPAGEPADEAAQFAELERRAGGRRAGEL